MRYLIPILCFILLLTACAPATNMPVSVTSSATATPRAAPATDTPAATPTASPLPTPTPGVSLTGRVWLGRSNEPQSGAPVLFDARLRQPDDSWITDAAGDADWPIFRFPGLAPGTYELWLELVAWQMDERGCRDVGLPDANWKWGKIVDDQHASFISGLTYWQAIMNGQPNTHIYAVLSHVEIPPRDHVVIDMGWITFICKLR